MTTEINFTPPPTIDRFMLSGALVRVIMGPIGSGKSTGCIMEIVRRCREQAPSPVDGIRRSRWAIIRNTRQQLRDTTLKTWLQWFPNGTVGYWRETDMMYRLKFGDVDAEILFRPLDTPDDAQRLLSLELTGAYINESREIPEEIVTTVRGRVGRYPATKDGGPTWYGVIADTNPPNMDSWWYNQMEKVRPRNWEMFKQPSGIGPHAENLENLPSGYYEDLMEGATEDWINVHVHGKYGRSLSGKPVYENTFVEEFHVAKNSLRYIRSAQYPLIIGMDFGRTPAAIVKQLNPKGRVCVLGEVVSENMGLERFITTRLRPVLASRWPDVPSVVVGDPAGWSKSEINDLSCADVLRAHGFTAVRGTTNDPQRRIEIVERLLARQIDGEAAYLVDPSCEVLIEGFRSGYRYRRLKTGEYESKPDKVNRYSHPHDANQYGCSRVEQGISGTLHNRQARKVEAVSAAGWS